MTLTETEDGVLKLATEALGSDHELSLESKLDALFDDSLEYLEFTLQLQSLGHLSDEAIAKAETLGDLANAIVHPN